MATKKSGQKSSPKKRTTVWSLNKISMWTLAGVALLYVVSLILGCINAQGLMVAIASIQGIATAVMIGIVSVLAWRYVKPKEAVWKVLYVLCLLLVIVGIIIPIVMF